jgi:hypothetical protein
MAKQSKAQSEENYRTGVAAFMGVQPEQVNDKVVKNYGEGLARARKARSKKKPQS